jgi:polyhydroxyalkanoate synthesis regulator phasin
MDLTQVTLIDGVFQPDEARELLTKLINHKIQYHQVDAFSKDIRNIEDSAHSTQRIKALEDALATLQQTVKEAEANHKRIVIKSDIALSFE